MRKISSYGRAFFFGILFAVQTVIGAFLLGSVFATLFLFIGAIFGAFSLWWIPFAFVYSGLWFVGLQYYQTRGN